MRAPGFKPSSGFNIWFLFFVQCVPSTASPTEGTQGTSGWPEWLVPISLEWQRQCHPSLWTEIWLLEVSSLLGLQDSLALSQAIKTSSAFWVRMPGSAPTTTDLAHPAHEISRQRAGSTHPWVPWQSPQTHNCIWSRHVLSWELLMTEMALGQRNKRIPPHVQARALALTRHANCQRKSKSWASRSPS